MMQPRVDPPEASGPSEPRRRTPRFDDPLSWSIAVVRLGGVSIRVHAVMLATILVLVVRSEWFEGSSKGILDSGLSLVLAGWLVLVPLVSEWTRAVAIRWLGGAASEVVLHPFGGFDVASLPPGWRRQAVASWSGLGIIALVALVAGIVLYGTTGMTLGVAPPSPLSLNGLYAVHMLGRTWLDVVFLLEWACIVVLVANLLPVPPMRAWLLMRAIGRPWLGASRCHRLSLRVGVGVAVGTAVAGFLLHSIEIVFIALFCGVCVREEFKRLRAFQTTLGHETAADAMVHAESMLEQEEAESLDVLRRLRMRRKGADDARLDTMLDGVLDKIAEHGRASLSRKEEQILKGATKRRRNSSNDDE